MTIPDAKLLPPDQWKFEDAGNRRTSIAAQAVDGWERMVIIDDDRIVDFLEARLISDGCMQEVFEERPARLLPMDEWSAHIIEDGRISITAMRWHGWVMPVAVRPREFFDFLQANGRAG